MKDYVKTSLLLAVTLVCVVSCTKKSNTINGHEYVDLGLSVKWATCNVGAESPSDYGDYFAWGETEPKEEYTEENSVTYWKHIGSISGNSQYDAARANWGGTWRMPTVNEIDEFVYKCKREWTTQGVHEGYRVTGPNGNSIFLPAAGLRDETSLEDVDMCGYYWSATPYEGDSDAAHGLYFYRGDFCRTYFTRYLGGVVRPVSE